MAKGDQIIAGTLFACDKNCLTISLERAQAGATVPDGVDYDLETIRQARYRPIGSVRCCFRKNNGAEGRPGKCFVQGGVERVV